MGREADDDETDDEETEGREVAPDDDDDEETCALAKGTEGDCEGTPSCSSWW